MTEHAVQTDDQGQRYIEVDIGIMVPKMRGAAAQMHQARLGIQVQDKNRRRILPTIVEFYKVKITEKQFNEQRKFFETGPVFRVYWNELKRGQVFADEYGKLVLTSSVLASTGIIG